MTKSGHTTWAEAFAHRRPWPALLRGLLLWELGWILVFVGGVNYVGTTIPYPTRQYLQVALDLFPGAVYGGVFITVALFCIFTSYCHHNRDQWGLVAASVTCGGWGLVYLASWVFHGASLRAVGGSVIWFGFAVLILTMALIPRVVVPGGACRR